MWTSAGADPHSPVIMQSRHTTADRPCRNCMITTGLGGITAGLGGAFATAASVDRLIRQQPLQSQRQVVPAPVLGDPLAAADGEALPQPGIKQ